MSLIERVRRTIHTHALAARDTRVVVALSGGPDSVALAHLLLELDVRGDLRVAGFAHFNHQLRPAAQDDERFCTQLASRLHIPIVVDRGDVAGRARIERRSLEDAARAARYLFFDRAREHFAADVVALGHTRDDQAETFLLRLLRGAGARGLSAMHPRRAHFIRPLLDCRRVELRDYLEAHGSGYVIDDTNADVGIPRNRVRAELLPFLASRFNPAIVDVLANEAAIARDEWWWMEAAVDELAGRACRSKAVVPKNSWSIDADVLNAAPPALARRLLSRVLAEAARGRPAGFTHVEQALELARSGGPPIDGPGLRMQRCGSDVVLTGRPAGARGRPPKPTARENLFGFPLSIPGEVHSADGDWAVTARTAAAAPTDLTEQGHAATGKGPVAIVQLDRVQGALVVRGRRPGDRFGPPGLRGRKKLQDFFVDLKVRREARDHVPIVVDESDRIVWVAGYAIDREFAVTDAAQAVLILRLKRLGGPV